MNNEGILFDENYFRCLRFNTTLLKIRCVERQGREPEPFSFTRPATRSSLSYDSCKDCDQGREIKEEIMAPKPCRGNGSRETECPHYRECLDKAAKSDWKTWKCDECWEFKKGDGVKKPEISKPKNDRICSECGLEKTINPKQSLGPRCMAARARAAKDQKKKKTRLQDPKKAYQHTQGPEKASPGGNTAVKIEFGRHIYILREIKALAEDQVRTIDEQIIFLLKKSLETIQKGGPPHV